MLRYSAPMEGNEGKTVLLVEDNVALAGRWCQRFRREGWAVDAAASVDKVERMLDNDRSWEVVFLDLKLDDGDSACLIPRLSALIPRPAIAVVSGHLEAKRIVRELSECAVAIPKPFAPEDAVALAEQLRSKVVPEEWVASFCRLHRLSPRESAVVHLFARHNENAGIARELRIAAGTLATYWNRIFTKTGCKDRPQLMAALYEHRARM